MSENRIVNTLCSGCRHSRRCMSACGTPGGEDQLVAVKVYIGSGKGMIDLATQREPTPQEETEQHWAEKLARNRIRLRSLTALRNHRKLRIVNHRVRNVVLSRLLDPSPRDGREG